MTHKVTITYKDNHTEDHNVISSSIEEECFFFHTVRSRFIIPVANIKRIEERKNPPKK
jgi:hypothetical protein